MLVMEAMPAVLTTVNERDDDGVVRSDVPERAATVEVAHDFEAFYRAEWRGAARLAFLMIGSEARAEEIAQDAFVALHQRWSTIDKPSAYLRSAVVNRSRDRFRRHARWQQREHLLVTDADRKAQSEPFDGDAVELLDAVRALPPKQRAAIVLRYWGGLTEAEIAEALEVRPGTVKSLIHRAMIRLRTLEGPAR